jgi:hypothetical protein
MPGTPKGPPGRGYFRNFEGNAVRAVELIRRMPGSSRSILVRADDARLYVTKMHQEQQPSNLLANEVMGSELLRCVGLPSPFWKPIFFSTSFTERCRRVVRAEDPPVPGGYHFASTFALPREDQELYEILPGSFFGAIVNPADFLGVYIFDTWANHHDRRQALFLREIKHRGIHATFIDNGHLFGGPEWSTDTKFGAAMYMDRRVYTTPWEDRSIEAWVTRIRKAISPSLSSMIEKVPRQWYTGQIKVLIKSLEHRLENLSELFRYELENNPRLRSFGEKDRRDSHMQVRDSRILQVRNLSGWRSTPTHSRHRKAGLQTLAEGIYPVNN